MGRGKRTTAEKGSRIKGRAPRVRLPGWCSTGLGFLALSLLMVAVWAGTYRGGPGFDINGKSRLGESIARYVAAYGIGRRR